MRHVSVAAASLAGMLFAAGCASGGGGSRTATAGSPTPVPLPARVAVAQDTATQYPSTYRRHPNPPVLIRNATIMTAAGQEIQGGSILFREGRIVAVGTNVNAPTDATVVDGTGKWVTPGVIDTH